MKTLLMLATLILTMNAFAEGQVDSPSCEQSYQESRSKVEKKEIKKEEDKNNSAGV